MVRVRVRGPALTSEPMSKNVPSKCERIAQKVAFRVTCSNISKVVSSSRIAQKVPLRVTCHMSSKVVVSSSRIAQKVPLRVTC